MKGLLHRAWAAGLAVSVEGGRLALEGPEDAEALALELLASESDALAELAAERARREAEAPLALLPAGADAERPPAEWYPVRPGRLAGCWIGPEGALASAATTSGAPSRSQVVRDPAPPATCWCCRRAGPWWRLRVLSTGAPGAWLCATCHAPGPPEGAIERREGEP